MAREARRSAQTARPDTLLLVVGEPMACLLRSERQRFVVSLPQLARSWDRPVRLQDPHPRHKEEAREEHLSALLFHLFLLAEVEAACPYFQARR